MRILCWLGFHKKGEMIGPPPTEQQVQRGIDLDCTRILSRVTYVCAVCGEEFGKRGVTYLRGMNIVDYEIEE